MNIDLEVIAQIESSNNPAAFNEKSGARGLCQITPICLKDYNEAHPKLPPLILQDLFSRAVSLEIAGWYLDKRIPGLLGFLGVPATTMTILFSYNWGPGHVSAWYKTADNQELKTLTRVPRETVNYYKKYCQIVNPKEVKNNA